MFIKRSLSSWTPGAWFVHLRRQPCHSLSNFKKNQQYLVSQFENIGFITEIQETEEFSGISLEFDSITSGTDPSDTRADEFCEILQKRGVNARLRKVQPDRVDIRTSFAEKTDLQRIVASAIGAAKEIGILDVYSSEARETFGEAKSTREKQSIGIKLEDN